jgi:septal ring factor EnvC (AmiA/AmiB activator)
MNKTLPVLMLFVVALIVKFAFADAKQPDAAEIAKQLEQLNAKLDAVMQTQAKLDTIIAKQDQTMEMLRMRRLHTSL